MEIYKREEVVIICLMIQAYTYLFLHTTKILTTQIIRKTLINHFCLHQTLTIYDRLTGIFKIFRN